MSKPRVLLIGWDAADWKIIRPLLNAGEMPALAGLMARGVHGNLATAYPILSPILWTSIATGKRAYKHGIHGFSEPLPAGTGVRPITTLSRKSKAVWNILNQTGHRSMVIGWWPSHPAEPINGVMVSNHFQQVNPKPDGLPPLMAGTVHPRSLGRALAELRVNPTELTGEFLQLFVPEYGKVDQTKDKRLHSLAKIVAETMSVHAAATELFETEPWDFAAVYYTGIDHFGHGFMSYHPPRLPWTSEADFEIYHPVIANAYRYHDAMLGRLLEFTDENTTVIVMSDHGFHSDHMRPGYIPAEPAGPAVEHRHFGIFCMAGPSVRAGAEIYGASVLDVCPTILSLYGLPPGADMDGKVLTTAFERVPDVDPIKSWDDINGEAGTHAPDAQLDPVASAEAFQQLVELGYVEPPGPNMAETVDRCVRELRYNLARAYLDANHIQEAASLVEALWDRWHDEPRFGILLVDCLGLSGRIKERRRTIEELERRLAHSREAAREELAKRKEQNKNGAESDDTLSDAERKRRQYELRRLTEQAMERPVLLASLWLRQALLEGNTAEARRQLDMIERRGSVPPMLRHQLAEALIQLGDLEEARSLLEASLELDPESVRTHGQLAVIHFRAERYDDAIAAATETLSLLYFQPEMHSLLGQALLAKGRPADAEKALLVAVAQNVHNLGAHEALGRLYRDHLHRPDKAFEHEGRAMSLRNALAERRTRSDPSIPGAESGGDIPLSCHDDVSGSFDDPPGAFPDNVEPGQVITVVSGLPRSGTSLMMQCLTAGGMKPLVDNHRPPDEDNPLGYFEFEPAKRLRRDKSWIPQARGKVVKIVAQLLPLLPRDQHYNIVFMTRNIAEVVASQRSMLERLQRSGTDFNERRMADTFRQQTQRVLTRLRGRPEVRVLTMRYEDLVTDPSEGATRLAHFVGGHFDRARAANVIQPELWRHKAGRTSRAG